MAVVLRHGWAAALPGKARGFNGCGLGRRTPVTASGLPSFWCRQAGGGPPAVSASPDIITHAGTRVRKQTHRSVAALPPAALYAARVQAHAPRATLNPSHPPISPPDAIGTIKQTRADCSPASLQFWSRRSHMAPKLRCDGINHCAESTLAH